MSIVIPLLPRRAHRTCVVLSKSRAERGVIARRARCRPCRGTGRRWWGQCRHCAGTGTATTWNATTTRTV